jgi:transposase
VSSSPVPPGKPQEVILTGEGIEVHEVKAYGIGIDTHRDFIQISVLVKQEASYYEYRHEFPTDWDSLLQARKWAIYVIENCSVPSIKISDDLHFVLESTAVYHCPVIMAWGGHPSIINPVLAGSTVRKTDVCDASRMAYHDLTGIWRESFVPNEDIKQIRVLISERTTYNKLATRTSNRINSILIRFGINISRNGSVAKNPKVRQIVEDLLSESPSPVAGICPSGIPNAMKSLLKDEYEHYDLFEKKSREYHDLILSTVTSLDWKTRDASLGGRHMLDILTSAPGVGELTASIWLANIIDPNRFPNSKACSAYCGLDPSLQVSAKHVTGRLIRKGNKELHSSLVQSASILMKNHNELFGRYGYLMYLQTGSWKKATNAVARKLAIALYHMQLSGEPFSYDKYTMMREIAVMDIPLNQLPLLNPEFKRYMRLLNENGIHTTAELAASYYTFELSKIRGIGKKCMALVKDFVLNQKIYRERYDKLTEQSEVCNADS